MSDARAPVVHLHSGNLYGGVETLLVSLAATPGRYEHRLAACFPGRVVEEYRAAGGAVVALSPVRLRYPWTVRRVRRRTRAFLEATRPYACVTHSAWSQTLFAPVVGACGLPLVEWFHAPPSTSLLERRARRWVPDLGVCTSAYVAAAVDSALPHLVHTVVHPPVRPPPETATSARERIRGSLGATAETVVILHAGRPEPWKGQAALLEALARLQDIPGWALWFAGGAQRPVERAFLQRIQTAATTAGIADRVRFLGARDDMASVHAAADVYCQPNLEPEPFGIVFVEALYAGRPVVTTAAGGPAEIVTSSCGLLVSPGDRGALAAALERLIREPALRTRLGAGGPARARAVADPTTQLELLDAALAGLGQET